MRKAVIVFCLYNYLPGDCQDVLTHQYYMTICKNISFTNINFISHRIRGTGMCIPILYIWLFFYINGKSRVNVYLHTYLYTYISWLWFICWHFSRAELHIIIIRIQVDSYSLHGNGSRRVSVNLEFSSWVGIHLSLNTWVVWVCHIWLDEFLKIQFPGWEMQLQKCRNASSMGGLTQPYHCKYQ